MEDSLNKRYRIKLFANIISGLIGAIIISIVPKALGPIAFGQFVYLQEFFMKIIGFLDMGSSIAFFTKLSARQTRKELITFYLLYSFLVLLLVIVLMNLASILGYTDDLLPDIPKEYVFMGLLYCFFTWFTQIFIKISDANALTVSVELIKIGHKVVSLLLLLLFVYQSVFNLSNYFYYNYIVQFSFLIIITFLFIKRGIFKREIFRLKVDFKSLTREFVTYCSPLLVTSAMSIIFGVFDIWLLQKNAGSEQTGFYGLAYSIAAICFMFTSAMTPIITREFSKSYQQKDFKQMKELFIRYIPMLYSVAAFFAVFVSFQSEHVLDIFTDERFKNAYLVLIVISLYPIYQTYGQLSGSVFYATGQTKLIRNISFITQPLGMVLSFTFIYLLDLGALGLAVKMLIGGMIGINIQLYFNAKLLNFKIKYFILHQIYSILFFCVLAFISSNIINFDSPVISFLISGVMYTLLVMIFSYLFPQVFAMTRDEIKQNLRKLSFVVKK